MVAGVNFRPMTGNETLAVVGVAGGAGATRLSVELAATVARAGRDVAVLDAAFATQGLSQYTDEPIDPDFTAVLADDAALDAALVDLGLDAPGRVALAPAYAPFERIARAKTPEAARRLEDAVTAAVDEFDHVVVDTPAVAANQAVAAVSVADRIALVAPATERGADATSQVRGRLADVDARADVVVGNRGSTDGWPDADHVVPETPRRDERDAPVTHRPRDPAFARAVADVAASALDADLELSFDETSMLRTARRRLSDGLP